MLHILLAYAPTIISTIFAVKDLKKGPIKPGPIKPGKPNKPNKIATTPSDKFGLFMTVITLIPAEYVITIIKIIVNYTFKLIKSLGIISYVLFLALITYALYLYKDYSIIIHPIKDAVNLYLPNMPLAAIQQLSQVFIVLLAIGISWFVYNIMFHKKPDVKLDFVTQNGYNKLIETHLPAESSAWGKALLIMFYLGCGSILIYCGLFFAFTLPALVITYGVIKTPVVEIARTFTFEEKMAWLQEIKLILVDMEVPTRIITSTLEKLLQKLDYIHTQNDLLLAANVLVNQAYTLINSRLKLSFWHDVVLQNKLFFFGFAVVVVGTISVLAYLARGWIHNDRQIKLASMSLTKAMHEELSGRQDYLAAASHSLNEAIAVNGQVTGQMVVVQMTMYENLKSMIGQPFWNTLQREIDNLLRLGSKSEAATALANSAFYQVSDFEAKLLAYPNPSLLAACEGLKFQGVVNRSDGWKGYWEAFCHITNAPYRALTKFNMEKAIKTYESRQRNGEQMPGGFGAYLKELLGI